MQITNENVSYEKIRTTENLFAAFDGYANMKWLGYKGNDNVRKCSQTYYGKP